MIDNIKFFATNKDEFEQNVCKSGNIDFIAPYSIVTGEMMDYPQKGKLSNLNVCITPTSAYINGSLHKFYNCLSGKEEHNYNDFNYYDLVRTIDEMKNYSGLDSEQTKITNLEFGFNVLVDENPQGIIDKNVMMFNHKSPSKNLKFAGKGDYKEFQKTDYSIKIYNKSKQYNQWEYILRVEIKITMKRVLERFGIFNLNDLKDKEKLKALFEFFIEKIERVHIIDEFEHRADIPKKVKDILVKYTSPFYWKTIFNKPQNIRDGYIREFEKFIKTYKLDTLKTKILDKIRHKFKELLEPEHKEFAA